MGAFCSSPADLPVEENKGNDTQAAVTSATGTFGRDPNLNPRDFMCSGLEGEVIIREPGTINGQQFIIEECKDCDIYLFDRTAQVNIDECKDCRIFVGPCESSVFIRDCTDCKCVFAVQQLRTRNLKKTDILLYSQTEPVIESSSKLRLGCFDYSYFDLQAQFEAANLNPWNNRWSDVHDFTPGAGHWKSLPKNISAATMLRPLPEAAAASVGVLAAAPVSAAAAAGAGDGDGEGEGGEAKADAPAAVDTRQLVVPVTFGNQRAKPSQETCFVAFFAGSEQKAFPFLTALAQAASGAGSQTVVLQTAQLPLVDPADPKGTKNRPKTLFKGSAASIEAAKAGPIIALAVCGDDCVAQAAAALTSAGANDPRQGYSSPDAASAQRQIRLMFVDWRIEV